MESVLFPDPPFWVVNTIVCILRPLDGFQRSWVRFTRQPAFCGGEP